MYCSVIHAVSAVQLLVHSSLGSYTCTMFFVAVRPLCNVHLHVHYTLCSYTWIMQFAVVYEVCAAPCKAWQDCTQLSSWTKTWQQKYCLNSYSGIAHQALSFISHCTLYTVHCTLHTSHCTLHTAHCTWTCTYTCTTHWTLHTEHCTLPTTC